MDNVDIHNLKCGYPPNILEYFKKSSMLGMSEIKDLAILQSMGISRILKFSGKKSNAIYFPFHSKFFIVSSIKHYN